MSLALFVSDDGGALAQVARAAFARAAPGDWGAVAATERPTPELEVSADLLVAIGARPAGAYALGAVERWPQPDADAVLAIERRAREIVGRRLAALPRDRTAHERRLAAVLPGLARDFEPGRSPAEIRACAEAVLSPVEDSVLARFADASWRAWVLTAADRQTRECLCHDVCELVQERAAAFQPGLIRSGGGS